MMMLIVDIIDDDDKGDNGGDDEGYGNHYDYTSRLLTIRVVYSSTSGVTQYKHGLGR